eukprot:gene10333-1870_t
MGGKWDLDRQCRIQDKLMKIQDDPLGGEDPLGAMGDDDCPDGVGLAAWARRPDPAEVQQDNTAHCGDKHLCAGTCSGGTALLALRKLLVTRCVRSAD